MEYLIRRGDSYSIPFPIIMGRYLLSPEEIEDVQIAFNDIIKSFKNNEVIWNKDRYQFEFPLTEEDTYNFDAGQRVRTQVRYKLKKFDDNDPRPQLVTSFEGPTLRIMDSLIEDDTLGGEEIW